MAAWHSVLPVWFARIFRKPSVIFLAGTDCAYFPSVSYGNFCRGGLAKATAYSVRNATHLAPKHASLIRAPYSYHPAGGAEQGVACFVHNFATPYTVIPNGFSADKFFPMELQRSERSFITVAAGIGTSNINVLKGIDLILQAAQQLADCSFTIVGVAHGFQFENLPHNVTCLPPQSQEELRKLYSSHRFYMQLSLSEGFPNAVCEAMLCGCVPVVSDVNALPDIAGDAGFVLKKCDVQMLAGLLKKALEADFDTLSLKAIHHIRQNYDIKHRQQKLIELFEKLTSGPGA